MKTRILIIDDEIDQLDLIKTSLARKSDQWEVEISNHPEQALASIDLNPPTIVIADHHMPQMSGIDFLKQVAQNQPGIERFILAEEEGKEDLEEHLGSVFNFLPKPCSPDNLINEVQRVLAIETWLGNDTTKKIVAKMGDFPSLPPVYLKVMNALNSRDASAERVGKAISGDLAISAKLLQVVNSSYYGLDEKVSDIVHAVSILGMDIVKNLVLAIQVYSKLAQSADQKALTDQLWHHSMSVATAARRLMQYESRDSKLAEEAYTAGLFHDIGKLVLLNAVPADYEIARQHSQDNHLPLWQAEREIIGATHCDTGAYLLGRWGMAVSLVETAALHHEPINSFGSGFSSLSAVHAANALAWERHPNKKPHPDAAPDSDFLVEIGKADSWDTWRDVVTGKITEKPKPSPKQPAAKAVAATEREAPAASSEKAEPAAETPEREHPLETVSASPQPAQGGANTSKLIAVAVALAVCLGLAIWLAIGGVWSTDPEPTDRFASAATASIDGHSDSAPASQPATPIRPTPLEGSLGGALEAEPVEASQSEIGAASETPPSEPEIVSEDGLDLSSSEVIDLPKPEIVKDVFPAISLTGIFYNPTSPAASINGKIRRVGDTVAGAEITHIERKYVLINYKGEERTFKIN